jgi:hypothetical protein
LQAHYDFGKKSPSKKKNQKWASYSNEVMMQSDGMQASIITTRDVLGTRQVRKLFKTKEEAGPVQQDVDMTAAPEKPDAEMTAATESSDEELAMELRTCRQCDSKMKIRECQCEASMMYRDFGRQLTSKKSSSWSQILSELTGFVTTKRQRLDNLKNEEGEKQSSSPEVGSAAQSSHGAGAMPKRDEVDEQSRKPGQRQLLDQNSRQSCRTRGVSIRQRMVKNTSKRVLRLW